MKPKITIILTMVWLLPSCSLDINDDPNNPTTAELFELLPAAEVSLIGPFSDLVNAITSSAVQTRVSTRHDNFTVDRSTVDLLWTQDLYSGGLKDLEEIIALGTETENFHYTGIAKIFKAYIFSMMVDVWDDLPFTDAFQPSLDQIQYDDGAQIYEQLFVLIDEGIADLDKPSSLSPGADDLIYNGDLEKWKKMGETLKMKMLIQIRLVDTSVGNRIQQIIDAGNYITSPAEDFQFHFNSSSAPENRMPLFVSDYVFKIDNRISTYFHGLLDDNSDPRIPYYFFNQTPGTFVGRDSGNPEGLATFEDQNTRTFHGVYPAGGKFDDGNGGVVDQSSGLQGAGTFRMITNAMRLFMEAEAVLELGVTGSAPLETLFTAGITEAMGKVNEI
ncbi:MAG: SusD/RagB family nutrient-binding outer membrane lipoprotein, partial [Aurantibacter sp.]